MFLFRMCTSTINFIEPQHTEGQSPKVMNRDDTRAIPSPLGRLEQFVIHRENLAKTQEAIKAMDARINGYEIAQERYTTSMKEAYAAGNKTLALQWLKMLKKTQANLKNAYESRATLELTLCEMESVAQARQDIQAQQQAADSLRSLMSGLTPDGVQRVQEDLQHSVHASEELSMHLGRQFESRMPELVGEETLLAELEEMMSAETPQKPLTTAAAAAAPQSQVEIISPGTSTSTTKPRPGRQLVAEAIQ